jgi:hypothetical protein
MVAQGTGSRTSGGVGLAASCFEKLCAQFADAVRNPIGAAPGALCLIEPRG